MRPRFATCWWGKLPKHERLANIILLAVCIPPMAGCASQPMQEGLRLPFWTPGKWEIGHQAETGVERITEFVRPGQTVENWVELVTVQTFDKRVDWGSIDSMLEEQRKDLAERCPGSTLDVIRREADSVLYESSITNCPELPNEKVIGRILDGRWNRFLIVYSTRAPELTAEKRTEWINMLSKTAISVWEP